VKVPMRAEKIAKEIAAGKKYPFDEVAPATSALPPAARSAPVDRRSLPMARHRRLHHAALPAGCLLHFD